VRDRFGIFGTVTRFRELSLLLVMMLRIPNTLEAFALFSPRMSPSYSAMLFVALNSSLAAYFSLRPDGAIRTAAAPAPDCS